MFFSDANAADSAPVVGGVTGTAVPSNVAAGDPSMASTSLMFLSIVLLFYVLVIRPQQKKIKQHDTMVKALRRGDKIVTGGGVIGTIAKIEEEILVVEIAPEVKIKIMRDSISHVVTKIPVANDNKSDEVKGK